MDNVRPPHAHRRVRLAPARQQHAPARLRVLPWQAREFILEPLKAEVEPEPRGWRRHLPLLLVMAVVLVWRPHGLFGAPPAHARMAATSLPLLRVPSNGGMALCAVLVLVIAAMPLVAGEYTLVLGVDMLLFALFAASLGLVIGPGGMGSFGHAAYFGLGAYGAALAAKAGAGLWLACTSGVALAATAALVFGWFSVRLAGTYMAMLTLAFAQITWSVVFQWDGVTGGSNGLTGVWPPEWLADRAAFYWFVCAVVLLALALCAWLVFTPLGYAVRAARDSAVKARAIGLSPAALQWRVFTLAGALAGVAGALYAFSKGSVAPDALSIPRSVDALVMVLLGGVETVSGAVVGAIVFKALNIWLVSQTDWSKLVLGAIVVLIVVAFPKGIVGMIESIRARRESQSSKSAILASRIETAE